MNEYMEKYLSIHSFSFSGQCLVERRKSKIILCASIPVKDRSVHPSWYEQGVRVRGGVLQISSDRDDRRIFLGRKKVA